jgi:hypothetical protein
METMEMMQMKNSGNTGEGADGDDGEDDNMKNNGNAAVHSMIVSVSDKFVKRYTYKISNYLKFTSKNESFYQTIFCLLLGVARVAPTR